MDRERTAEIAIRSVGRPRLRWEEDVRADLGKIKMFMKKRAWKRTVEKAKSHEELSLEKEEEEEEGEKEKKEGKKKKTKSLLRQHTFRK
jgi:hypothetical protein